MQGAKWLVVALAIGATPGSAVAGNWYLYGAAGTTDAKIDQAANDADLRSFGATNISSSVDQSSSGFKAQVGYQINRHLAVEGGYVNLGKFKYNATFTGGNTGAEIKVDGWNVSAVGFLPMSDRFAFLGKAGLIAATVSQSGSIAGLPGVTANSVSTTDVKPSLGVGIVYDLSRFVAIRAEYEKFFKLGNNDTTGESDVNMLSVGVVYRFLP
jgi:OmpA-OmpF porin, OOP family